MVGRRACRPSTCSPAGWASPATTATSPSPRRWFSTARSAAPATSRSGGPSGCWRPSTTPGRAPSSASPAGPCPSGPSPATDPRSPSSSPGPARRSASVPPGGSVGSAGRTPTCSSPSATAGWAPGWSAAAGRAAPPACCTSSSVTACATCSWWSAHRTRATATRWWPPSCPAPDAQPVTWPRRAGSLDEGIEVLGHGPAEGDDGVAPLAVETVEELANRGVYPVVGRSLVVEGGRRVGGALEGEGAVVHRAVGGEALGQAADPRPLLAGGAVPGPGHDVLQADEGIEPVGAREAGAHQHVLVGEGQHRPAQLVVAHGAQHRL